MAISGDDFGESTSSAAEEVLARAYGGALHLGPSEALDAGHGTGVSRFAGFEGCSAPLLATARSRSGGELRVNVHSR